MLETYKCTKLSRKLFPSSPLGTGCISLDLLTPTHTAAVNPGPSNTFPGWQAGNDIHKITFSDLLPPAVGFEDSTMFSLLKSVGEDPTNFCAARRGLVLVAMVVLRRIYGLVFPVGMSANPKGQKSCLSEMAFTRNFLF